MQKIDTTINKLADAEPALTRLLATKFDAKTRYHLMKLANLVRSELREHLDVPRQGLFKEFGVERQPTDAERAQRGPSPLLEVPQEKLPDFMKELDAVAAVAVTIPWGPITAAMMEAYPDISGADLLALGPLFELETTDSV